MYKLALIVLFSSYLQWAWTLDNTYTHGFGNANLSTTSNIVGKKFDPRDFPGGLNLLEVNSNNSTYPLVYGTPVTFKKSDTRVFQLFHNHMGGNRLWLRNLYHSSSNPTQATVWNEIYHAGILGTGVSSRIPSSTKRSNVASFIWNNTRKGLIVGASTLPTGFKQAVAGKVIAEEVVVKLQSQWLDYVFKPEYTLRPLAEVEAHIQTHGHLPEVPRARQVERLDMARQKGMPFC